MRETFCEYYPSTNEEFSELWKNSTIVFDANILLNIYRYSPSTRDNLLDILEGLSDRIWIPYQAALEYQKNRLGVIYETSEAYDKIIKTIEIHEEKLSNELTQFKIHPYINIDGYLEKIKANLDGIKKEIENKKNNHPNLLDSDEYRERITSLFKTKVGKPYSEERLNKIYEEGEKRYKKQIPPGFKDNNKEGEKKYGDLVLWHQILDQAKSTKKSIIFVTDDKKEDWWNKSNGKTFGPHPSLIREIISEANVKFYMYRTEIFMTYANKHIGSKVNDKAIKEAVEEIEAIRTWDQKKEDLYTQINNLLEIPYLKETAGQSLEKYFYESYVNTVNRLAGIVRELLSKYSVNNDDIELEIFTDVDGTKTIIIHYIGKIGVAIIPEKAINELKNLSLKYGIKIEVVEGPV